MLLFLFIFVFVFGIPLWLTCFLLGWIWEAVKECFASGQKYFTVWNQKMTLTNKDSKPIRA